MRTLTTFLTGFLVLVVAILASGSEVRTLTPGEETELRDFAEEWISRFKVMRSEGSPVDVWQIESSVVEKEGATRAHTTVVFRPATTPDHCIAPTVKFIGTSPPGAEAQLKWQSVPEGASAISFRFWFSSCDEAEQEAAVHLGQVLDFDVLNKIRKAHATIIDGIREHDTLRGLGVTAEWELQSIAVHYSPDDGVIYHLRYFRDRFSGLWANVVFQAHEAHVIDGGPITRGAI